MTLKTDFKAFFLLLLFYYSTPSYSTPEDRNELQILLVTNPILPMCSFTLCGLAAIVQFGVGLHKWRKASFPVPLKP